MKRWIAVLLAACGENQSNSSKENESSKTGSSKPYATVKEYLESPENARGIEDIKKNSQDTMEIDVKAEGNTVVYDYTYKTAVGEDSLEKVKESFEQVLDGSESSFNTIAQQMQAEIEESIQLKVAYHDSNGTLLAERTYTP